MLANKRALFIAPHTDDVELGCGATLARCIEECDSVTVVVFSIATQSLPKNSVPDRLKQEFINAMEVYGLPIKNLHIYDFPVRRLNYFRQDILDNLIKLRNAIDPNLVFTPALGDVHQDHEVISQESIRAFKSATVLGYELPWNHFHFQSRAFIDVTCDHLHMKIAALKAYETQVEKGRPYFDNDFIMGLAKVRGVQQGSQYAEAFDLITLKIGFE